MVLLELLPKRDRPHTIAVLKNDGTGYREIAHPDLVGSVRVDWSWDNRYVALRELDRTVVIAVADGQKRELMLGANAATDQFGTSRGVAFSPDGRFIASEIGGDQFRPNVFVLPTQGGEPLLVAENSTLLDWTKDGRFLAIPSARSGSAALYLVPMKGGSPAGEPVFVRYGSFLGGRTTATGALVYKATCPGGNATVFLAPLAADGQVGSWVNVTATT